MPLTRDRQRRPVLLERRLCYQRALSRSVAENVLCGPVPGDRNVVKRQARSERLVTDINQRAICHGYPDSASDVSNVPRIEFDLC